MYSKLYFKKLNTNIFRVTDINSHKHDLRDHLTFGIYLTRLSFQLPNINGLSTINGRFVMNSRFNINAHIN